MVRLFLKYFGRIIDCSSCRNDFDDYYFFWTPRYTGYKRTDSLLKRPGRKRVGRWREMQGHLEFLMLRRDTEPSATEILRCQSPPKPSTDQKNKLFCLQNCKECWLQVIRVGVAARRKHTVYWWKRNRGNIG